MGFTKEKGQRRGQKCFLRCFLFVSIVTHLLSEKSFARIWEKEFERCAESKILYSIAVCSKNTNRSKKR